MRLSLNKIRLPRSPAHFLPVHNLIPLHLLRSGQTALISIVAGDRDQVHRLRELGMRDGTEVEMVQPGSPCIVRLGGQRLCVRCDEVTSVMVQANEPA